MEATRKAIDIRIARRSGGVYSLLVVALVAIALTAGILVGQAAGRAVPATPTSAAPQVLDRGPQGHMSAMHHRICVVP